MLNTTVIDVASPDQPVVADIGCIEPPQICKTDCLLSCHKRRRPLQPYAQYAIANVQISCDLSVRNVVTKNLILVRVKRIRIESGAFGSIETFGGILMKSYVGWNRGFGLHGRTKAFVIARVWLRDTTPPCIIGAK